MQPPLVESAPHVLKGVLARAPTDSGRDYLFCSLSLLMTSRQSLSLRNVNFSISLVVQWLRIHLPMLGTSEDSICWGHGEIPYAGDMGRFHMLGTWGDSICCRATKSVCHNYWAHALEPTHCSYGSPHPTARAPQQEAVAMRSQCTAMREWPRLPQPEKRPQSNEDPAQPKINK